ncbi:MAG: phosphonoacetate hydrolase [Alphaproteobacteria bacterium]
MSSIELHGRTYRPPSRPTVVICADGCDPAYIEAGLQAGVLPTIARWRREGFYALCDAAMPTFTNPNNLSIVTGAPPAVHGISGNFALDRDSGVEIMMTDPEMVRGDTILALMSQAGVAVAAITAKDKLRRMLGKGIAIGSGPRNGGICFSSEQADHCTVAEHGIAGVEALVGREKPDMYSADLSLFVLDAGIRLVEQGRADLLYLSLSDYVQHGHAPDEPEALDFHAALDARLARLEELGCTVALTADHGMNDKALPDDRPHVIFLEDVLNAQFGSGAVRVICPITDPFVRHHGALGSFVRVYRRGTVPLATLAQAVRALPGIDAVLTRDEAAALWELPRDREADLVATGDRNTVIGASAAEHDLSALAGHRLRSHGGAGEQTVPFLLLRPLSPEYRAAYPHPDPPPQAGEGILGMTARLLASPLPGLDPGIAGEERVEATAQSRRLRNFDIFDFALNGTAP